MSLYIKVIKGFPCMLSSWCQSMLRRVSDDADLVEGISVYLQDTDASPKMNKETDKQKYMLVISSKEHKEKR